MRTLVVYDSMHGNTEKIAQAVGDVIGGDTTVVHVSKVTSDHVKAVNLLIVGSPTHGGRPTPPLQGFLKSLSAPAGGARAAVFDTRLGSAWVKIFGFASNRMARELRSKGWNIVEPVEGFRVKKSEGPLLDGELQRAASWARELSHENA